MASYAKPLLAAVPEENQRRNELLELMAAFEYFVPIDPDTVPPGSLLHEFIG
jgi:uridine kinase